MSADAQLTTTWSPELSDPHYIVFSKRMTNTVHLDDAERMLQTRALMSYQLDAPYFGNIEKVRKPVTFLSLTLVALLHAPCPLHLMFHE